MQFLRLVLCTVEGVALSGGAAACLAGVISASPPTFDQTQSTNASAVRSTFLARLQRLADGGRLSGRHSPDYRHETAGVDEGGNAAVARMRGRNDDQGSDHPVIPVSGFIVLVRSTTLRKL